ncbi:MAG: FKBP-type peptidyl-prolyl cis-trans isomerase [Ginsengibacter sp.]
MKKFVFLSIIMSIIALSSCKKNQPNNGCQFTESNLVAPESEQMALLDSLNAHNIQATKDPAGFYYTINNPGTPPAVANLCSTITVFYKGSFFNGAVFDSTTTGNSATFELGQVILGWQKGIPLIKNTGDITLYIPPSLGYGSEPYPNTGPIVIPANSYLIFHVVLEGIM